MNEPRKTSEQIREEEKKCGHELAEIGAQMYFLADKHKILESAYSQEFFSMMGEINNLSYRLLYGKEKGD